MECGTWIGISDLWACVNEESPISVSSPSKKAGDPRLFRAKFNLNYGNFTLSVVIFPWNISSLCKASSVATLFRCPFGQLFLLRKRNAADSSALSGRLCHHIRCEPTKWWHRNVHHLPVRKSRFVDSHGAAESALVFNDEFRSERFRPFSWISWA